MANIMSLKNVRNKASRNGFDLSKRTCFTAKVGEILPVWWKFVLPCDKVNIDLKSFTRTQPVNTASFGRVREYYDFFFVPLEQLWKRSHTVLTQMLDNNQSASGLNINVKLSGELPALSSVADFNSYLENVSSSAYSKNVFGFDRANLSCKLLSYLGYSQYPSQTPDTDNSLATSHDNPSLSLYPLLAYQKIYADFFRYTQWESPNPSTFNVDWMNGNGDMILNPSTQITNYEGNTMFDLRYCNYQKDLFHGILPNAQFGSTAAVPISGSGDVGSLSVSKGTALTNAGSLPTTSTYEGGAILTNGDVSSINMSGYQQQFVGVDGSLQKTSGSYFYGLNAPIDDSTFKTGQFVTDVTFSGGTVTSSSLSILALRQAEALQRWKEIAQAAEEDYKQQIQAHWNVTVSDLLSGQSRYLGGYASGININEVVNTNLVNGDASQPADLAGKGIGSLSGNISYDSQGEYGVIMCVYHALPLLDYITTGTDTQLLHVTGSSFPIPEMDSIGMELLPSVSFRQISSPSATSFIGYVPRYIDWKTDYDRCLGGFTRRSLQNWILPFADDSYITGEQYDDNPNVGDGNLVSYEFFKVNPHIVDPMFSVNADSTVQTDHLLCQAFFDVKFVRNLDVNGLPY